VGFDPPGQEEGAEAKEVEDLAVSVKKLDVSKS
jgi:hypothetical protein